ncbi:hypothetical protein [Chryseobacterium tongliaoense]|uniref:hypothetical protein n=1 Tax=Chryseobacterium tongliaoense TaxID=3240933 RepID=UPI003510D535
MTVSNKDKIIRKMNIFLGILILDIFLTVAGFILKSFIDESFRWPLFFFSLALGLFIIIQLINLRIFHFENSGAIFSIKRYHPLKSNVAFPVVEYPVNMLRTLKKERFLFSDFIIIEVHSKKKNKLIRFSIKVSSFSERDYRRMRNSFQ